MNKLKHLCMTILELIRQVLRLPQSISKAVEQKRWQAVLDKREAERLDRIRNPSKYLGK